METVPLSALPRDLAYVRGLRLFDDGAFYESHEVLEEVWRRALPGERFFLQAIIHFAVAWVHSERGNPEGARRQIAKCTRKLAGYLPCYGGIDTWALYHRAAEIQAALDRGQTPPAPPRLALPGAWTMAVAPRQ